LEPRAGFEPATYSLQALSNGEQYTNNNTTCANIDWPGFEQWVKEKKYRGSWSNTIISNAKRYGHCLVDNNLAELAALADSARPNVLKALAALSKFLGINQQYKKLIQDFGLKMGRAIS
jgi:hypothetical protein